MITRNLRWQLIGVALTMVLLGGCGAPTQTLEPPIPTLTPVPPTATAAPSTKDVSTPSLMLEDLTGTWHLPTMTGSSVAAYLQLNKDGTFRFALSQHDFENQPDDVGQFRLEGTLITFTSDEDSRTCAGQSSGTYEVELTGEDQLNFQLREEVCPDSHDLSGRSWRRGMP